MREDVVGLQGYRSWPRPQQHTLIYTIWFMTLQCPASADSTVTLTTPLLLDDLDFILENTKKKLNKKCCSGDPFTQKKKTRTTKNATVEIVLHTS